MTEETVVRHINEGPVFQDSIEIGSPSKGGAIKVYGDAGKKDEFEVRIRNMILLRKLANDMNKEEFP